MKYTPESLGAFVKASRNSLHITQRDLAMTSGTGLRFIVDLEKGKPTCQLGKALAVMHTLGIDIKLTAPSAGQNVTER